MRFRNMTSDFPFDILKLFLIMSDYGLLGASAVPYL